MNKSKESKYMGAKVKQNTSSATNIEEKQNEEAPNFGDIKLQRQWEREKREAKEFEDRKRIADLTKQETKKNNTKKKNKKTAQQIHVQEAPKVNKEVAKKMEVNITENASGTWNIKSSDNKNIEESNIMKQEYYNNPEEPQPRKTSLKINRDFDYYTCTETAVPTQAKSTTKEENINYSEHKQYNWRDNNSSNKKPYDKFKYQNEIASNNKDQDSFNYQNRRSYDKDSYQQNHRSNTYDEKYDRGSYGQNHSFNTYAEKYDTDFQTFGNLATRNAIKYEKTKEITGDLFSAPTEYSLAHCVAEDMSMGAGIAKTFRSQFGRVGELLNQRAKTGGLAVLDDKDKFIYYLVTKKLSRGKPTIYTLWLSLNKLKQHIQENNVNKLAIPQIGCGLDRLDWRTVRQMLEYVFQDVNIEIAVYILPETLEEVKKKMLKKCAVIHVQMKLVDMQTQTGLIYFGSVDGFETEEFKSLSTKYNIVAYKGKKEICEVIKTVDKDEYLYGLIIKNAYDDEANFKDIERCIRTLWTMLKKDKTLYVGVEAFIDKNDELLFDKIIALMQYIFLDVEIWVCWPDNLKHLCPQLKKSYY